MTFIGATQSEGGGNAKPPPVVRYDQTSTGKVLRESSALSGWVVDRDYVYRGDKLLSAVTPPGARHFHVDHLGSVRQVTSSIGVLVASRRRGS